MTCEDVVRIARPGVLLPHDLANIMLLTNLLLNKMYVSEYLHGCTKAELPICLGSSIQNASASTPVI
jgi:hypothetical protein